MSSSTNWKNEAGLQSKANPGVTAYIQSREPDGPPSLGLCHLMDTCTYYDIYKINTVALRTFVQTLD